MPKKETSDKRPREAIVPYLPEYIKNPIMTTLLTGNWSLPLCKMVESIIMQLQDRINEHIKLGEMNSLVDMSDTIPEDTGMLKFEIPIKTLGIPSQNYDELDAACNAIMDMKSTITKEDGSKEITNVFHKVIVPANDSTAIGEAVQYKSGMRRKGIVEIKMHIESAREILNLRKGYVEHIFGVPQLCRSPRTHRLYVYLSAWLDKGGRDYPYNELKEWLGVIKYDAHHKNIISDSYKKYSEFSRAVLKPAQVEMKKLCEEGKVDFYFDYEPVYPQGKTKGTPYAVRFITHISDLGRMNAQGRFIRGVHSKLISQYKITPEEWDAIEPLISELSNEKINSGLLHLASQMKKATPECVHAYATKVLKEWAIKQERDYVEYEDETISRDTMLWNRLSDKAKKYNGEWWNTYGVCCKPNGIDDDKLIIKVPSSFVAEQWNEHVSFFSPLIKELWNVSSYVYEIK